MNSAQSCWSFEPPGASPTPMRSGDSTFTLPLAAIVGFVLVAIFDVVILPMFVQ